MAAIYHNGDWYGLGSEVVANPQDSATDTLSKVGIDGTVYEVTDADAVHTSDIGTANGVAELDANGVVPKAELPSDVVYDNPTFSEAGSRANIASGESFATILGKIKKFFTDLKAVAFSGSYSDLSDKPTIPEVEVESLQNDGVYLYRQSPANGTRALEAIVGGSVGWNQHFLPLTQLSANRCTISVSDNVATLTVNSDGVSQGRVTCYYYNASFEQPISGHKYYLKAEFKSAVSLTAGSVQFGNVNKQIGGITTNTWTVLEAINFKNDATGTYVEFDAYGAFALGDTVQVKNLMAIDLTALFGTAIADYVYTLETATAGSGIAWLKSQGFLTEDYYAYDSGSIQSVVVDRKEVVGFNLWDETPTNGLYQNGVLNTAFSSYISSADKTPIPYGVTSLFFHIGSHATSARTLVFYDNSGNWIGDSQTRYEDFALPVPSNAAFFNFSLGGAYGTTYKNDICINISKTTGSPKNGEYLPYHKETITYDNSKTLRGIPKLVNNSIQYDGDVYRSEGIDVVRFEEITFDGSSDENWYIQSSGIFRINLSNAQPNDVAVVAVPKQGVSYNNRSYTAQDTCWVYQGDSNLMVIDSATTLADFKTNLANKPLTIVYQKATPTTLSTTPFTNPQKTAVGGTEEFVDYLYEQGTRDVAVPVGHNTQYKKLPTEWDDDYMLYLQNKAENALQTGWHDSFAQLSDTSFSNLANGQIPKWNSTSGKWENANESGGGGASSLAELSDTNISSPADGQILKYDNATSKWVNANEYSYTLPMADANTLGGIKVGDNLSIDNSGVLSSNIPAWTKYWNYSSGTTFVMPTGKKEIMLKLVNTTNNGHIAVVSNVHALSFPSNDRLGVYWTINNTKFVEGYIDENGQVTFGNYSGGYSMDFEIWVR